MDLLGNLRFVFADRLKHFREAKRWTQHDLAAAAEMSVSGVRGYEQKSRWPDPEEIEKLATVLGCDVQDLLGYPKTREITPQQALEVLSRFVESRSTSLKAALREADDVLEEIEGKPKSKRRGSA